MPDFLLKESDGFVALFVNVHRPPESIVYLPIFQKGEGRYYQLVKVSHSQDGVVRHEILDWAEVGVPEENRPAVDLIIQAQKSVEKLLGPL